MKKYLSILLLATVSMLNTNAFAKEIAYQGKVTGMVCAFCSYNVAKKIASIPGVIDASVNVNLKSGKFSLLSTLSIKPSQISETFTDSGFKLSSFSEIKTSIKPSLEFEKTPKIQLNFSISNLASMENILDEVGDMAIRKPSKIQITAQSKKEIDLLKLLIAGKQRGIKIEFISNNDNLVTIKLFQILEKI